MIRRRSQETTTGTAKNPAIQANIIRNSSIAEISEEVDFFVGGSAFTVDFGVVFGDCSVLVEDLEESFVILPLLLDDPVLSSKLYGQSKVPLPSMS